MKNAVKKLIKKFLDMTKYQPEAIVMFRDGVSDGHFTIVMTRELKAIGAA